MKFVALIVEPLLLLQPVVQAELHTARHASTEEVVASETVRSLLRGKKEVPETWGMHLRRALSQLIDGTEGGKRAPHHFTARVQFNGTFPGPGAPTSRSMTSYWIYGEEHQERLTSMMLSHALSSPATVSSTVYDSVTMDRQTVETELDVWKRVPGACSRSERVQRLVDSTGNFSICRFCPQSWQAWGNFPSTQLTKGVDEVIAVSVGEGGGTANIDCETYEWHGDFGAMHKVWFSKQSGLVVKEVQRQEEGMFLFAARAEVTIAYDAELPSNLFGSIGDLFAPPPECSSQQRVPHHFTARIQFNGTFPGPGSATLRSMTSYWIFGEEHQERLTSMVLTRALSSAATVSSTVYDSVTMDGQTMETMLNVWKGVPGTCSRSERAQRLVDGTGNFSICRFCPQPWQEWFPSTTLTKRADEVIAVSVGEGGRTANIDCEIYEWLGDFDAMHKVWFSKQSGHVVKEIQRQAGGPNPYVAVAEMAIAYDAELPRELFGSAPTKEEMFVLPAGCSHKA